MKLLLSSQLPYDLSCCFLYKCTRRDACTGKQTKQKKILKTCFFSTGCLNTFFRNLNLDILLKFTCSCPTDVLKVFVISVTRKNLKMRRSQKLKKTLIEIFNFINNFSQSTFLSWGCANMTSRCFGYLNFIISNVNSIRFLLYNSQFLSLSVQICNCSHDIILLLQLIFLNLNF